MLMKRARRIGGRIVEVVLLRVSAGKGGEPVGEAGREVVDLTVRTIVFVVARDKLEGVSAADDVLDEVTPGGFLVPRNVAEIADGEEEVHA